MTFVSPRRYPFLSVGVVEIWYGAGERRLAIGSGFLFRTAASDRRTLILGAGHNLVHLGPGLREARFTFYTERDVRSVAVRPDGTLRYAVAGVTRPFDFGVMVLAEDAPPGVEPISLRPHESGPQVTGIAAGALAGWVVSGNRAIAAAAATAHVDSPELLYLAPGTTDSGMSGGPVLTGDGADAEAIGVIHGAGRINGTDYDLAVATSAEVIAGIDDLVAQALGDDEDSEALTANQALYR